MVRFKKTDSIIVRCNRNPAESQMFLNIQETKAIYSDKTENFCL